MREVKLKVVVSCATYTKDCPGKLWTVVACQPVNRRSVFSRPFRGPEISVRKNVATGSLMVVWGYEPPIWLAGRRRSEIYLSGSHISLGFRGSTWEA
jgi:hypothetical protein